MATPLVSHYLLNEILGLRRNLSLWEEIFDQLKNTLLFLDAEESNEKDHIIAVVRVPPRAQTLHRE